MPTGAANPDARSATCEVRDWVVFGPGFHKGGFYSPEMCERVPANFARLRDHLKPLAKIGHDRQQRLAKSLGFINVGKVKSVRPVGGGNFALTITDVPVSVGAEINAGRLNSGSVELLPKIADPDDPSKEIDGPVLTGVAFLGEEQPAVKGFAPPRAVFADGTPVPPATDPAPWLNAMAEVTVMSATAGDAAPRFHWFGREYAAQTICFSEMQPMDPKAQLAALGLTPEQIEQVMQICAPPAPAAVPSPPVAPPAPANEPAPMGAAAAPGADSADMPPWGKQMSAQFAELTKRFGAYEAAKEQDQKKDCEAQMAAFNAQVDTALKPVYRKVAPVVIEKIHKPALLAMRAATFSSESERVAVFNDYVAGLMALPDDTRLKGAPVPGATPGAEPSQFLKKLAGPGSFLDNHAQTGNKLASTG